jgi:predicted O-methyltransferase YrrM
MSLSTYLSLNQITDYEGHSGQISQQTYTLGELCNSTFIKSILEIGFNAGHSANTFLSTSLAHVTSFDLNERECVRVAKDYIDLKYPTRHTLIIGDSTQTIPPL